MRRNYTYRLPIADCRLRSKTANCLLAARPNLEVRNSNSAGLTLVEVIASTMIVSMMAVATLNALGAATKSSDSIGNRAIAAALADELMSEIVQQPYSDPDGSAVFGRETGESASPRSAFDDVDDYDAWTASPPQFRDGTVIPDRVNWRHSVTILRVSPASPTTTSVTDQGVKRIRVTVEFKNQVLADQTAIRTDTDEK